VTRSIRPGRFEPKYTSGWRSTDGLPLFQIISISYDRPVMRRLSPQTVDELDLLFRTLLEFRSKDGKRLPPYAEAVLFFLGKRPDYLAAMGDLRETLDLPQPRTGRICAALEKHGVVQLYPSFEDRRSVIVKLTDKGLRLIDKTISAYRSRDE
jgi:DNA-binding MarR family transcriptional regulator